MAYIGVSPSNGVRRKHTYTATAAQTSFTGAGAEGITLSYLDSNYVDVYQNGVKLSEADYTSTTGTTVVLATGAFVSDMVEIVVYDVFSVADTVSKSAGGTFDGNITAAGTLAVTGETTLSTHLNMGDGDKIKLGASSDLTIQHTGNDSRIIDSGTGDLFIGGNAVGVVNAALNEYMINAVSDGAVSLYHNNVIKLATASGGVNVTGGIGLGGTGAANTLDDYEEGTWTPTLQNYGGTPTIESAIYTKVGRLVYASCAITLDGTSDASGFAILTLPFTSLNTDSSAQGGVVTFTDSDKDDITIMQGNNSAAASVMQTDGSTYTYNEFGNDKQLRCIIIYSTA